MMGLAAIRLAIMERFAEIPGVIVPPDPLPMTIDDKTILVFPRVLESTLIARGRGSGSISIQSEDVMQTEYHRRIPYEHLGSTMGDITEMIETLTNVVWSEAVGGKFDGTILSIRSVALMHFGALGWNEWTFGARLEIAYTHLSLVAAA